MSSSAQRLGLRNRRLQAIAAAGAGASPAGAISSSSAAFTAGWLLGSFRYQQYQPSAQTAPSAPNMRNAAFQPQRTSKTVASGGASAPPALMPAKNTPCARARSPNGIHRAKLRETLGAAPASAAPNRNRIAIREVKVRARAVAAVKKDHKITITVSTRLGP